MNAYAMPSCRSIPCAMVMCYSMLCCRFLVCLCCLLVDRAFELVKRVIRLNITIMSSSCHDRNAEHIPSLVF